MIDRSLICSFFVKMWEYFQLYLEYWMLLSDSILRNMLCSGRIVAADMALGWTIVRFWLHSTHSTFFCAPSGKQPFPIYGSQVPLCVMRIMIVNAWGLNPGLQFGGPQSRLSTCVLKMKIVTLHWDPICNLPTIVYMWSICCLAFCSGSDLSLFSPMGRALSPEPHHIDCSFVLVPIELSHSTNITAVLYWNGSSWKYPKGQDD